MTELRRGAIGDRWVIVAPMRGRRPSDLISTGEKKKELAADKCPFCPGNENRTPPEIYRLPRSDGSWQVRVIPNKFPALGDESDGTARFRTDGLYQHMAGQGTHEVIIESPDHLKSIPDLPLTSVENIIDTFHIRLQEIRKDPRHRFVVLFENHGSKAGASLAHPHAQIIATPVVPPTVKAELQQTKMHYLQEKKCLFCELLKGELESGERLIEQTDEYVVFAPYASCFPFEITITPRQHVHSFTMMSTDQRKKLAAVLKGTLHLLKTSLEDPPYNLILQDAPNVSISSHTPDYLRSLEHSYHWRIAIIPRLTTMAGLEFATGFCVNPVSPEEAARFLKKQAI